MCHVRMRELCSTNCNIPDDSDDDDGDGNDMVGVDDVISSLHFTLPVHVVHKLYIDE